jgi:alpha-amylase
MYRYLFAAILLVLSACNPGGSDKKTVPEKPVREPVFNWSNATIYFLLTDRFNNGDPENDITLDRTKETAYLRNFMGGDIRGITEKISDGYFTDLGVTAIWLTPPVEQVHGSTDEGTGVTYGYHGYWARDWTALDPNFGTMDDLRELVYTAHENDIRIVLDVVLNHTGPVTEKDSPWPDSWVRMSPVCTFEDAETTIECTLVENLPDIITKSEEEVELPDFLIDKWKEEGRYDNEIAELDAFFAETGLPRAPKYYIMKWLTDFVKELGIDGFRVDTAKHTQADVWGDLYDLVAEAFEAWKERNPDKKMDDTPFYMVGEVYGYSIGHGRDFPMGGGDTIDFFDQDFTALINFAFKYDARRNLDSTYAAYSYAMNEGAIQGHSVLNYISSHDDGDPMDRNRELPKKSGTMLMLAPGAAQIYYGDELARPLFADGANGDANLRTFMNWESLDGEGKEVFNHWSKLGKFRKDHPAVGAGKHIRLMDSPYVFARTYSKEGIEDEVVVALDSEGAIDVSEIYPDGVELTDHYNDVSYIVENGSVQLKGRNDVVLLAR